MDLKNFGNGNHMITLENENIRLTLTNFGASILSLVIKGKEEVEVALAIDDFSFMQDEFEFNLNSIIGRYAGVISDGKLTFKGKDYKLDQNDGYNTLNSGYSLWSKRSFGIEKYTDNEVIFQLLSKDKDQGFPGELDLEVSYILLENGFEIKYDIFSNDDTISNITHNLAFNLNGRFSGNTLNHKFKFNSDFYLPTDEDNVPTGLVSQTKDTPIDFKEFLTLSQLKEKDQKNEFINEKPLYFVTDNNIGKEELHKQVEIIGDKTNIKLEVYSDFPCIMFNPLENISIAANSKESYNKNDGFILSPQYFPNACNISSFNQEALNAKTLKTKMIRCLFKRD